MRACVFGLLLVNSRMNLNGHHLTFHLSLYAHTHTGAKHTHAHKELVYRMRNGVGCGVLRILSGVCLCVCEVVRLIGVNRDNLSLRALQDPLVTIMILCRTDEWQESF